MGEDNRNLRIATAQFENKSGDKSIFTALLPVILLAFTSILKLAVPDQSAAAILGFIGDPAIAILITVLAATYTLGLKQGKPLSVCWAP